MAVRKTLSRLGIPIEQSPTENTPQIKIILGQEGAKLFTQIDYRSADGKEQKKSTPINVSHGIVFLPSMDGNRKKIERIVVSALNQIKRAIQQDRKNLNRFLFMACSPARKPLIKPSHPKS